jgi:asparagine synthase (glutamine-hydrolysing)
MLTDTLIPTLVDRLPRLRRIKRSVQTLPISDPARRYAAWLILFNPEMQAELLQSDVVQALGDYDPAWSYPYYYAGMSGNVVGDHLNNLMYVDLKTWLADVYMEKMDKATMSSSLEARLPLLDHRLVELAFRIPSRYKVRGSFTKRIFKQAVSHLLPPEVLRRPKRGFSVPTDAWFRGKLKDYTFDVLMDERTRGRGYFNMQFVERLYREHISGRHVWDSHLWLLINFELWNRMYLDSEPVCIS